MTTRISGATWKPLSENTRQRKITPRVVILHSAAGATSPWRYFEQGTDLESTCWVALDGKIEQYLDTNVQADANYKANGFAGSIETANHQENVNRGTWDSDPWTPEQIASIVKIIKHYHDNHGVPYKRIDRWDGSGVGYHIQFGSPGYWTPVSKACPGARRIQQYNQIIIPALQGSYTDGDPVTDADILRTIAGVDAILQDDFKKIDARNRAFLTNAINRCIRDQGGTPSIPNRDVPEW